MFYLSTNGEREVPGHLGPAAAWVELLGEVEDVLQLHGGVVIPSVEVQRQPHLLVLRQPNTEKNIENN